MGYLCRLSSPALDFNFGRLTELVAPALVVGIDQGW
jgi:hypothetical protein